MTRSVCFAPFLVLMFQFSLHFSFSAGLNHG
jgi:hypothetical protein